MMVKSESAAGLWLGLEMSLRLVLKLGLEIKLGLRIRLGDS